MRSPNHEERSSMTDQRRNAVLGQQKAIRDEFRQQAPRWGKFEISEHLRWVVEQLPLSPQSEVVDVAAGTGLFGRAVAPAVARVTAVDITPEMIEEGRRRAEEDGIANMTWRQGEAEALPFPDESFDLAITRYSIHHFVDPSAGLREMGRTCRRDGTIVAVDMGSDEDPAEASRQGAPGEMMSPTHPCVPSPSRLGRAAPGGA